MGSGVQATVGAVRLLTSGRRGSGGGGRRRISACPSAAGAAWAPHATVARPSPGRAARRTTARRRWVVRGCTASRESPIQIAVGWRLDRTCLERRTAWVEDPPGCGTVGSVDARALRASSSRLGRRVGSYHPFVTSAPCHLDAPSTTALHVSTFGDVARFAGDEVALDEASTRVAGRMVLVDALDSIRARFTSRRIRRPPPDRGLSRTTRPGSRGRRRAPPAPRAWPSGPWACQPRTVWSALPPRDGGSWA